jgi:hypothetical protein
MPREAHLASGVAGLEESEELGLTPVVEAFVALSLDPCASSSSDAMTQGADMT